jgi:hypothetical protein
MNKANDIHSHNKSPYFSTTSLQKKSAENAARNYKFSTPVCTFMQQHNAGNLKQAKLHNLTFLINLQRLVMPPQVQP